MIRKKHEIGFEHAIVARDHGHLILVHAVLYINEHLYGS